ncbi:hypothetical protein [Erwinia pyrifoliae]|nr:hypothetical protein [Erwinia pyrifoliae]UWS29821.1 hypothetical protein NYP81_18535 [Erwinia pyrifoliae]
MWFAMDKYQRDIAFAVLFSRIISDKPASTSGFGRPMATFGAAL